MSATFNAQYRELLLRLSRFNEAAPYYDKTWIIALTAPASGVDYWDFLGYLCIKYGATAQYEYIQLHSIRPAIFTAGNVANYIALDSESRRVYGAATVTTPQTVAQTSTALGLYTPPVTITLTTKPEREMQAMLTNAYIATIAIPRATILTQILTNGSFGMLDAFNPTAAEMETLYSAFVTAGSLVLLRYCLARGTLSTTELYAQVIVTTPAATSNQIIAAFGNLQTCSVALPTLFSISGALLPAAVVTWLTTHGVVVPP